MVDQEATIIHQVGIKSHNMGIVDPKYHFNSELKQQIFCSSSILGPHTFDISEEFDEEEDFLEASWASSKTVCSDAFDFLFDEKNMNPETVLDKHPDVIEIKPDSNFGNRNGTLVGVKDAKCCVIS